MCDEAPDSDFWSRLSIRVHNCQRLRRNRFTRSAVGWAQFWAQSLGVSKDYDRKCLMRLAHQSGQLFATGSSIVRRKRRSNPSRLGVRDGIRSYLVTAVL
jgi:hypothetical protein